MDNSKTYDNEDKSTGMAQRKRAGLITLRTYVLKHETYCRYQSI